MEHLGKQEKYLFGLNGSFRRDNDGIQQESIIRNQWQGMMVPTRERSIYKVEQHHQDRESAHIAPASKKGRRLKVVSFSQEPDKGHHFLKTPRTRRSETISEMMSHTVMLLPWFFWQNLSLENASDWKENSHHLRVGMLMFSFFFKLSFRYGNDNENEKIVFKTLFFLKSLFFKNGCFQNNRFAK